MKQDSKDVRSDYRKASAVARKRNANMLLVGFELPTIECTDQLYKTMSINFDN
jgi:hypothetical protein